MKRYTIKNFFKDFPDDTICLKWLRESRWPDGIRCVGCEKITSHYLVLSRKSYSCQHCGRQVYPTAGTIFHKSSTSLTTWFYVMYLMAQTRGGISAKQIERETGVTYKTAWRMCRLVREVLAEGSDPLSGTVEVDETFHGGLDKNRHFSKRSHITGGSGKQAILGMLQREGRIIAMPIHDTTRDTLHTAIYTNIEQDSSVVTDAWGGYNGLEGYRHSRINHWRKEYVRGAIHTNSIEGFWGNMKRGISGVYHNVSRKYLQGYVNEYCFRFNHRHDETPMFHSFLSRVVAPLS